MRHDYYSTLANVVMVSARDDVHKRRVIYELARSELRQQLRRRSAGLPPSAQAQELRALDAAIERIEAELAWAGAVVTHSVNSLAPIVPSSIEILPPERPLPPPQWDYKPSSERTSRRPRRIWVLFALSLLIATVAAGYLALERGRVEKNSSVAIASHEHSEDSQRPAIRSAGATIPMPSSYGVYAVTDGRLIELSPLPIKVPDQRVSRSATFASPSSTRLPNGHAQFIVFRQDMVNKAPEKVFVRVVAQILSAANNNDASPAYESDGWTIRDTAYEMKVAPVDGNRAMLLVRPAAADFLFPAGRYALVLKSVPYDFSVDGPATDAARCVEATDGNNHAAVYARCRE